MPRLASLLAFVLVSFAANSLITRHVVQQHLLDAGLLSCVRFVAGAAVLLVLCLVRRERPQVGRANLTPALWLGVYALCISYGYQHIGAAPGTFVFYAMVLVTLVAGDLGRRVRVPRHRLAGALIALAGLGVLATGSINSVTPLGMVLLVATGAAWGLYTAAGRASVDPRVATTGHFLVLATVLMMFGLGLVAAGVRVTAAGLGWAVLMGAGTTAFAYVAWYACQRALSGTSAGTVQLAIPLLTAVGAFALLGEALTAGLAVSAALVVAGLLLASRPVRAVARE